MKPAFTLVEFILALAIIAILAAMSQPLFKAFQSRNDLNLSAQTVANNMRRAQSLAQGGVGDSAWGVDISTTTVTLFKGGSFSTRDLNWDESFNLSAAITVSGLKQVVFSPFFGLPNAIGTTTLSLSSSTLINLTVNSEGGVNY